MVETPEIITLVLGTAGLIFLGAHRQQLRKLPFFELILISYVILVMSWLLTVLEEFFWSDAFNLLEHLGYLLSSSLLALWCWKTAIKSTEQIKK